jgi:hypothetical protein
VSSGTSIHRFAVLTEEGRGRQVLCSALDRSEACPLGCRQME